MPALCDYHAIDHPIDSDATCDMTDEQHCGGGKHCISTDASCNASLRGGAPDDPLGDHRSVCCICKADLT